MRPLRRFSRLGALAGAALWLSSLAAQTPPTADTLLNQTRAEAARSQRLIFAIFHASW